MIKNTLISIALTTAMVSTSFAKDTLYIVNSGSKGGSYNAQLTALTTGLNSKYKIEYVQAKGCKKTASVISKLVNKNTNLLSLYSSSSQGFHPDCVPLRPTKQNYMFANAKAGIIFSHKDVKGSFLTNGATVGISGNLDKVVNSIGKINGVSYKLVRYENAKSVTLGVLNKEVQFGISNGAKRFWKNTNKLDGHYVLFDGSIQGIPSVKKTGITPKPAFDVYIYFGTNREKLISDIKSVYTDQNSDYAKWYASQKGIKNNIMSSAESRFLEIQAYTLP